ncbi:MAG: Dabb family protein [Cyclobacteriaceae bacterium]|nr:Dabb family protein [Cyclobacteriaceae bacterium]MCK5369346.1 Dabb family protein [Cyclobacteriaceae bacterium]
MNNRRKFIKSASLIAAGAGAFGYHVSHSKSKLIPINKKAKKGMLHNVYFWTKEGVSDIELKKFEQGIKDFVSAVKEIQKVEIGVPAPTEDRDVVDHSFGYALFIWFKSIDDHNVYQKHHAHEKFINDFSGLWEKVKVYDSELI